MAASPPERRSRRARRRPGSLLLGCFALIASAGGLCAQVPAEPVLRGRVEADSSFGGGMVVLHRVAPSDAGEVDSVSVGPGGAFSFRLPSVPDPGGRSEVYFASIRHQGVLYFGPPISTAAQLDSLYRIEVHDTAAAPVGGAALPLSIRYMLVDPPPEEGGGAWRVTDLFQITNQGARTLVPSGGPVWTYPLPPGALDVEVGSGSVPPDAVEIRGDSVLVSTAFPPGQRQVVLRYSLASLPLVVPAPGSTAAVEVLVKEPAPPLVVTPLRAMEAVEMEPGVTYRRFAGADVRDAVLRVARGQEPRRLPVRTIMVIVGLTLAIAGLWAVMRRARPVPSRAASGSGGVSPATREAVLLEVARLDEARAKGELDEGTWRRARDDLLARLRK